MIQRLTKQQIDRGLQSLPGWQLSDDGCAILRTYTFDDFAAAFSFMTWVALQAEKHDHHPDWRNVYARVEVCLSTHDAGGLTERDLRLARAIDQVEPN